MLKHTRIKKGFQISLVLIVVFAWGCKKKDKPNESTWTVNNDTFSAKDYSIGIGKVRAGFSSTDLHNRFALGFYLPYLPTTGEWPVYIIPGQEPSNAGITFYYKGIFYIVSPYENAYLIATESNSTS